MKNKMEDYTKYKGEGIARITEQDNVNKLSDIERILIDKGCDRKLVKSIIKAELERDKIECNNPYRSWNDGQTLEVVSLIGAYLGSFLDKKILDIGCGATKGGDAVPPNISYLLSHLGAKVDGIDLAPYDGNVCTHFQANLLEEDLIKVLGKGKEYNAIIASNFFSSPALHKEVDKSKSQSKDNFSIRLISQIYDLLKKKGLLIVDPFPVIPFHGKKDKECVVKTEEILRSIGFRNITKDTTFNEKYSGIYLKGN